MEEPLKTIAGIPVDKKIQDEMGIVDYIAGPNYKQLKCETCGILCWIGPKSQALKDSDSDVAFTCMPCLKKTGEVYDNVVSLGNKQESKFTIKKKDFEW